jgi:hypothetical protein
VDKLKVWMLPTLALIKAEKVIDYVVGFDELGGKDDFTTGARVVVCERHQRQVGQGCSAELQGSKGCKGGARCLTTWWAFMFSGGQR